MLIKVEFHSLSLAAPNGAVFLCRQVAKPYFYLAVCTRVYIFGLLIKTKLKTMTNEQQNTYNVIYSNGVASQIYIVASNLKEAYTEAKKRQSEIGSSYYKVKRCYNGGVRG